jgi:putative heme-binding domain-containing protein
VQLAALRALSSFHHDDVAEMVLERLPSFTPAIRSEAISLLTSREQWAFELMDAVASDEVAPQLIDSAVRTLLSRHPSELLRHRAMEVFERESSEERGQVLQEYQASLDLHGDFGRGEILYDRECAACHKFRDKGTSLGPDLSTVRGQSPAQLLTHIIDPNREVAPKYLQVLIATVDGRVLTGMVTQESGASITLRRAEAAEDTVLRANIDELENLGMSLMPEGLEKKVSIQELADLIEFILAEPPVTTP